MKHINRYICESLNAKSIKQLEDIFCDMFRAYDGSWLLDELDIWVQGKENPTNSDYEEFIDDILAYCDEENITITPGMKHNLQNYKQLDDKDKEEIEIAILRGMSRRVAENK